MKKVISLLTILCMLIALVGCNPIFGLGEGEKDGEIGGIVGGDSENDGETDGDVGNDSETDGGNTENGDNSGTDAGEGSAGKDDDPENTGDGDTSEGNSDTNVGDGTTDGSENKENVGDGTTGGSENEGNMGDGTTEEDQKPTYVVGNAVGNIFRSITLEKNGGGTVSPDDYRGKIVIVNIWATWCPPCKAELPDFDRIAREYADQVVIIAAHDSYGRENAPAYIETNFKDSNIIFAYDSVYGDAFYAAGGTQYVPRTAILDQNGVIVYGQNGLMTYEQLKTIIENLI